MADESIRYYAWRFQFSWGIACTVDCQGAPADTMLEKCFSEHQAERRAAKLNLDYRRWNNIGHPSWTDQP